MRTNSLWFRLITSSAVLSIVLLATAAFLLNTVFHQALERNFDQRLRSGLDGVLANVELNPDGKPQLQSPVADTRFSLPLSGWYWQISEINTSAKIASSSSLLEQQLEPPADVLSARDKDGIAAFAMRDSQGAHLRAIEQNIKLFGASKEYAFLVTGNFDELSAEISAFNRTLFTVLAALGLALLAALFFQVRFALKPLLDMQHQLNDIRAGKAEILAENFPREIQPVADELNLLVKSNAEIVDRARMQVGNLAHALKTPISVLTNEARASKGPLASKVNEQLELMHNQINLYLDRARRAAQARAIGAATEIEPVVQSLARTLQRIHAGRKDLTFDIHIAPNLRFRGEKQDLEEMLGNVMDNACKWATAKIEVKATALPRRSEDERSWLSITVDDDGPGIPEEKRAEALKRGERLDESKPGSGLGMSIIAETAAMYSGTITLSEAKGGGLRVNLKLPIIT